MKVYNNLNTVVEYGLTFDTFKTKAENIYKDNYIYLEEIGYDGEGYFDLSINKLYWRLSPGKEYTVFDCVLNEDLEIPRNSTNSTIKIVSYTSLEIDNFLFLSEDVSNGFDENGNIITLLTEHTTLEVVTYKKMCSDIKQKRPTDESQDWEDTEETREYECEKTNDENEHCECGGWTYRWIEDGEVCDQGNRHKKMKYQYKEHCDDLEWKNVQPLMYKIGDIIEYNSDKCESYEYKEEWDETQLYCGYDLNSTYCEGLTSTSLYKIRYASIKKQSDIVWQPIFTRSLIAAEEVKKNCFQCGWSSGKTVTAKVETEMCGSEIKTKYPTLSGSVTDTYSYDVIRKDNMKTAPYPTNNDEMTQDEWVWEITGTTYSVSRNGSDCKCGYYTTGWTDTKVIVCGSELGSGYVATSQYKKYRKDKFCNGVIIEEGTEYRYDIYQSNVCACGYYTTKWDDTEEYLCGYVLNEDAPSITINKVQGNWLRDGYTFTSNTIAENVTTTERIYFSVSEPTDITFTIDQSSEPCCDYLIISKLDSGVTNSTSTGSSSPNYAHWSGKTTGTISMTVSDTNEHFISLMYRKDGSVNSGRDNVIVTLGVGGYIDTSNYRKQIENKYCGGVNKGTTGNYKWIEYEKNSYGCGYKSYRWVDTEREICCGMLENSENNCTNYYKYRVQIYQVTEDGTNWNNVVPERYRYGSIVETNSPDCGYVPKLIQWKLVCPDITYETAVSGDSCTVCETYLNAPTMYAIEKQQSSTDGGITWTDDYDSNGKLITRTEKILKWKADKCGYTGDTFAWFVDKGSRTCNGTNQVGTYYYKVSSDGGNTWTNVEGVEPEVRIIDKTNDDYDITLNCS